MAKKKAYIGTISSTILSTFVVILMLIPFYTANHLEGVRNGEGEYDFKEVMCFDINNISQLNNQYIYEGYPYNGQYGQGAFCWRWFRQPLGTGIYFTNSPMSIVYNSMEGTIDGYAVATTVTYQGQPVAPSSDMFFGLSVTWGDFLDYDVVAIETFVKVMGANNKDLRFRMALSPFDYRCGHFTAFFFEEIQAGVKSRIDVSVEDLINIEANSEGDEEIRIWARCWDIGNSTYNDILVPGLEIVLDMQFYCIEEFKIITIDWIGISMIGTGVLMGFCSILMLPQVTFSGVIGRIIGKK